MSLRPEHPATSPTATGKVCGDPRCATLLDSDAEICDECGGRDLRRLDALRAVLLGWADDRAVVFGLGEQGPSLIGRSVAGGPPPDVDLRRFPNSGVVHRRHARIDQENGEWRLTHLGTNALTVTGSERIALGPGQTVRLRSGDVLQVSDVVLQFVVRESTGRI